MHDVCGFQYAQYNLSSNGSKAMLLCTTAAEAPKDQLVSVRPRSHQVLRGSTVELYCIPVYQKRSPYPEITWYKDGFPVDQLSFLFAIETVSKGEVLVIRNVTMETEGNYTCTFTDAAGFTALVTIVGKQL